MSKKSKYVIVESHGLEIPIIFNPILEHKDVASNLRAISAGFCYRANGGFHVFGESIGLKIKSRPEDKELIERYLEIN